MEISENEWLAAISDLEALSVEIASWPEAAPNPEVERCEFSRHRTLAHLRAAQETWLEAVRLFAVKENPRLILPHPRRLFKDRRYELVPWVEHRAKFLEDRLV